MERSDTSIIWDPLVRVFHWSLVIAYTVAWLTGDDWLGPHEFAGYVIGGLVTLRVAWGLVGPQHARFSDFVYPPREVIAYLGDVARFRARRYLGHNPAGGAMVVALLITLLLAVISGILALDEWAGELFEEVHEVLANLTLLLVFAHVAGVLLASFQHHENLVRSMVTGRKPRTTDR
jgi:cytochrome b